MIGIPATFVPDGADPFEHLIRLIEEDAHRKGWDQGCTVHMLASPVPFGPEGPEQYAGVHITRLPLEGDLGKTHPAVLLPGLARALPKLRHRLPVADFFGVGLTMEAWGIETGGDAQAIDRALADAEARKIYTRDDKYELRMAVVATIGGHERVLHRRRGHEPAMVDVRLIDGGVMDAVRSFVQSALILSLITRSATAKR